MTDSTTGSPPAISGIHHLNLSVTDLQRSADWYRLVFGLEHGWDMDDVEGRGQKVILLLPPTSFRLVLSLHRANDGAPFSEYRTGLDHVAFTVPDRTALDLWTAHLDKFNVEHSEVKEGATGWLVTVRDPDSIQLEVYSAVK